MFPYGLQHGPVELVGVFGIGKHDKSVAIKVIPVCRDRNMQAATSVKMWLSES